MAPYQWITLPQAKLTVTLAKPTACDFFSL